MAVTVLGCFYSDVIDGKLNSISNFVEAVKAISAFYILWRANDSNAGIDNIYRNYFKGKDDEILPHHWLNKRGSLDINDLKAYLRKSLSDGNVFPSKEEWLPKATSYLKYDSASSVCRIALLIAAHDTIPDETVPGLMKTGRNNVSPYLTLNKWNGEDLRDIEHIAPQTQEGNWDEKLYDLNSKLYDSTGNLTLLPSSINISASNKGWEEKYLYYQHLGTKDPQKAQELSARAIQKGITLNKPTLELLQNSSYNDHIVSILEVGEQGKWDATLVSKRSERILDLLWIQVTQWL